MESYNCVWCGAKTDPSALNCNACGADVDIRLVKTNSGWNKLPTHKDMATLQFGTSSCQIEGKYVPVADMNLSASDRIYFAHHVLLWKDLSVELEAMSLSQVIYQQIIHTPKLKAWAHGPGHIAFSRDVPGELIPLPMQPGQKIDVREELFVLGSSSIKYSDFFPDVWFRTSRKKEEVCYPLGYRMDRFSDEINPGLLLIHAAGNVFVKDLGVGESILINPSSLIFKDSTVSCMLHVERPRIKHFLWVSRKNNYILLRVEGPGRVAVSSVFKPIEGENRRIRQSSPVTTRKW